MTTSHGKQNHKIAKRVVRASLFCAIALCVSIVPFSGAAGQSHGIAVIGHSTNSTPYPCTSGGINNAISDAITGNNGITAGVVDARNCTSMSPSAFTSEIDVGYVSGSMPPVFGPVTLLLPGTGTWTAIISDNSKFALKVFDKSATISSNSGVGTPFVIQAGSGSSLNFVCGNDYNNGLYVRMDGFRCEVLAGASVSQGACHFGGVADEAYFGHLQCSVDAGATYAPRAVLIHNACCSATFEMIGAGCNNVANCVPCTFGQATLDALVQVHVRDLTCNTPGPHMNNILRQQNGDGNNIFQNIYMEPGSGADTSTPAVSIVASGATTAADIWEGVTLNQDPSTNRDTFAIGSGAHAILRDIRTSDASPNVVNVVYDANANITLTAPVNRTVNYSTEPTSLAICTFANLGAVGSVGTMKYCLDCITSGTCAGSGNGHMAVSNGTNWTCQ